MDAKRKTTTAKTTTAKTLQEFYNRPERWCQRFLWKELDNRVTCACLEGALSIVYGDYTEQMLAAKHRLLAVLRATSQGLIGFNDTEGRTFEEIQELVASANV